MASEQYARLAYGAAAQASEAVAKAALGPYYGAYKVGQVGVRALDRAVLGKTKSRTLAGAYQLATGDYVGAAVSFFGHRSSNVHGVNEGRLNDCAKAIYAGNRDLRDLDCLLSPDPLGIPWLLGSWDVLGSAKRIGRRFIALAQGQGIEDQIDRARRFLADPEGLGVFNAYQLEMFVPLARALRGGR